MNSDDMAEKILLDKPETEDDTSIPKDMLGVKAFPGNPDVTEDDMDVTSGPRDFLGKPTNSMQKTESIYSQMTRALTEAGRPYVCPKCRKPDVRIKHEGDMCPPCEKAHPEFGNMDDSVQEMTTAADIATVPMGFKVDPEDKPTPEETAETGISLTGAPNRVPESHQRLPHLTAFLEEFGSQPRAPRLSEAMRPLTEGKIQDLKDRFAFVAHDLNQALEAAGQIPSPKEDRTKLLREVEKVIEAMSTAAQNLMGHNHRNHK